MSAVKRVVLAGLFAPLLSLAAVGAAPASAQEFDIEKVFWCDAGKTGEQTKEQCVAARTAILDNCTSCHAITPIVKAQKEPAQWDAMLQAHREKVPDVADSDFAAIRSFLKAHYTPAHPVPKLPPELDKLGVPPA